MTFFSKRKLRSRKIEIDPETLTWESPEVSHRLTRIQQNYHQLDQILDDLETKFKTDEHLAAIDQTYVESEQAAKKKRWRPRHKKSGKPRKPR